MLSPVRLSSVCRLSVVGNTRAPYSADCNDRKYCYGDFRLLQGYIHVAPATLSGPTSARLHHPPWFTVALRVVTASYSVSDVG